MKLQSILLLTGLAAGLMTVSCQSSGEKAPRKDQDIDNASTLRLMSSSPLLIITRSN